MFPLERTILGMMWAMWAWVSTAEAMVDCSVKLLYGGEDKTQERGGEK